MRLDSLTSCNVLAKYLHQINNNLLLKFCFFIVFTILSMIISLVSNQSFTATWSIAANFRCLGQQFTRKWPIRRKNIRVPILLLVYIIILKLVVQILAIVHIILIINNIIWDGLNIMIKIQEY